MNAGRNWYRFEDRVGKKQSATGSTEPKPKLTATTQSGFSCFMHHLTNIKRAARLHAHLEKACPDRHIGTTRMNTG